jgi:hypothetical protein
MSKKSATSKEPHPITAPKLRTIASKALRAPSTLSSKETRELGAEVLRHIEPRGGKIK